MGELFIPVRGESTTNPTLLDHLRRHHDDHAARTRFVDRYGRKLYGWVRRWGIQDADALDVAQSVLFDVTRQMATFEYRASASFRGWLETIAHRAWCDSLRARRRARVDGAEPVEGVTLPETGADLLQKFEEECERETLEWAMAQVRLRVRPHT